MGKYKEDTIQLLKLLGGKENILEVTHCITRMRFILGDFAKADIEDIDMLKAVRGSFIQGGQYQVIIGNTVVDFYNDFVDVAGIEGLSKDEVKKANKQSQNVLQRLVASITEIFSSIFGNSKSFDNLMSEKELNENAESITEQIHACVSGTIIPLKDLNDGVFSAGIVGEGFAITCPESDLIVAPVDATVSMIIDDSRHAMGLKLASGMEILIHIGLDTINMKGEGFEYLVNKNQHVKAGDPIIRFDREKIKSAGYSDTVIFIVTAKGNTKEMTFPTSGHVSANDILIKTNVCN